jgi:hypothetical protein
MKGKVIALDNKIIEVFDKGTTFIQRRGLLPLNTLIMGTECLFWSALITRSINHDDWGKYILGAASAICMSMSFLKWKNAHQYWENHRKTQELNATVLLARDDLISRMVAILIFVPFLLIEIPGLDLIGATISVTLIIMCYLRCCHYLGPGDYARQRRISLSGLPQKG